MYRYGKLLLLGAVLGWIGVFGTTQAGAAPLIPVLESVTQEGSLFRWTYRVQLEAGERVQATPNTPTPPFTSSRPDFFVIYDFLGFAGGATSSQAGWEFSSPATGPYPDLFEGSIPDNPAIPNLVWTRTGATITGPADLGTFSVLSMFDGRTEGVSAAETTRAGGPLKAVTAEIQPSDGLRLSSRFWLRL